MTLPYHPLIMIGPMDYISYYQELKTDAFKSSSTSLESTSLVFAYGLDLFFAPQRPALSYDILGEDFNYFVLVTSSAAVFVGYIFTHFMVRNLALEDRWK